MNAQSKQVGINWWGHQMDAKDVPTLDDDGEYSSYAKCSKCGAIENTDESVSVCPKAEYVHISVAKKLAESEKKENIKKWKSLCGCPMCEHHSQAFALNESH